MAKKTPFFKFDSAAWLGGSIQFTNLECKGLFIDLCALYWESYEPIKIDNKLRLRTRVLEGNLSALINNLKDLDLISVSDSGITVPFLDSLMNEREEFLKRCSKGGKNSTRNKGNSSNKKEERRKKKEDSREKIEECRKENEDNISLSFSSSEVPKTEPLRDPKAYYCFLQDYPKIGNYDSPTLKSAFKEAVHKADGEDVVLVAVCMFAKYHAAKKTEQNFIPRPEKWLKEEQWRVDWLDEKATWYESQGEVDPDYVEKLGRELEEETRGAR